MLEKITRVQKDKVQLKSGEWVRLSDKLIIQGVVPKEDDIAIVHTFGEHKLVLDITPQTKQRHSSKDELKKQLREFESLLGGY